MSNILLVAKGTGGDLVPFPKLGQELKKRGHRVTLFSHCSYAGMAKQNGWDFVALDTPEERQRIIEDGQLLNSPSGYPTYFRRHVLPRVAAEYEAIQERYDPGSTVLVTTHKACLVPLLAAEKLGIPLVRMFSTVSELITLPLMENMYQAVLGEELNGIRQTIGLPPVENWSAWLRKTDQEITLWPDWFAAPDGDWPLKAVPVGFIEELGEEINGDVMQTLKGAEPPILVSAGTGLFTDPRFYAASAEACGLLNRRGILVTRYPHLVPDNLPKQVQHFDQLPFASLMPHVAVVVHHGGVGSLACALAAGVPQLVLASGGDRPDNAERLQRLGVAKYLLPPRWEPEMIASALDLLLNSPSVRENCQAFALRLRASDAAGEACKWIEKVIPTFSAKVKTSTAALDSKTAAAQLIHKLSPEKQALLAQRLKEKRQLNRVSAEQAMVTGPMPVIPMLMLDYVYMPPQAWWRAFEMLVDVPRVLRPAQLKEVMQHLIIHHDGLRLRLVKENTDYGLFIAAAEDEAFRERDLSDLPASEQDDIIEAAKEELWASLNLSTGPLFRIEFFELGPQRLPRILITLHHFAADAYSVKVLLNDFQTACQQLLTREPVRLPAKTTSLKQWAERMHAYIQSDSARPEFAYWKSLPWASVRPTPVDHPEVSQSPYASLTGSLNPDETQALLNKVPAAYNVRLLDVLIAACVLTYARYTRLQPLLILLLHHGRNLTLMVLICSALWVIFILLIPCSWMSIRIYYWRIPRKS
jgi:rhamnosyltransferase subunit B